MKSKRVLLCAALPCALLPLSIAAQAATADIPYDLPVALPAPVTSPAVDPRAPYTPTVISLINQMLPGTMPTAEQIRNATSVLVSLEDNASCHSAGQMTPKVNTQPAISPMCFTDGLGIAVTKGPNVERATGMPSMLALAASFNLDLANAMGQLEGREGRNLMATTLLGPQADTNVHINWSRGIHTPGEDPWLNGIITAAQVNGIQGQGLMAQVKHFAAYNGHADNKLNIVQDQALHEMLLVPYEVAIGQAQPSSLMCSYARMQNPSSHLPGPRKTLGKRGAWGDKTTLTGALDASYYSCEHPLTLTYVLRDMWKFTGFVGSDYGGVKSTKSLINGLDREDPGKAFLGWINPPAEKGSNTALPNAQPGLPGPGCPESGCGLAEAVINGTVPLDVLKQSLARVLYQQERFGLLGCTNESAACANPGGIAGDRSGLAPLVDGPTSGEPVIGTRNGDAAIIETVAEQGAVLLKNDNAMLPITPDKLAGGIAVSGPGAEYLIANPTNEGAVGYVERNAINPLQQLKALSGAPQAFSYVPANAPTGQPFLCENLSAKASVAKDCGLRLEAGASVATLNQIGLDRAVDHSAVSRDSQLKAGQVYRWSGYVFVPEEDGHVFRIQHSEGLAANAVSLSIDGAVGTLQPAQSFYFGQYYGTRGVEVSRTNAGYTEKGLVNLECATPPSGKKTGMFADAPVNAAPIDDPNQKRGAAQPAVQQKVYCPTTPTPGWHRVELTLDAREAKGPVSFRFAVSRRKADIRDAAEAAKGKAMAVVFVHDNGRNAINPFPNSRGYELSALGDEQVELINAVAAANPNTAVVLNTGTPVVIREWVSNPGVKSLLNMWLTGQEGGTATARLLLGQANPGGHTTMTWPLEKDHTIVTFDQPTALYDGDTPGRHPERMNGAADQGTQATQGIYSGYRFYDKLGIPVQYPFGYGLSYTSFGFSDLAIAMSAGKGATVSFTVTNKGARKGAQVAQVYVGAGPEREGIQQAVRALRGFARVELAPGESKTVSVSLDKRAFQYWDEKRQAWVTNTGVRTILVGDANDPAHLSLKTKVEVK